MRSHQLQVALFLVLEAWLHCMLLRTVTSTISSFPNCLFRALQSNQITSIPSGAFAELGGLAELYVRMQCHISYLIFYMLLLQGTEQQPDHIDCNRRFCWTCKADYIVCYHARFFSRHRIDNTCFILHRWLDTLPATKAPFNMLSGTPLSELYLAYHVLDALLWFRTC